MRIDLVTPPFAGHLHPLLSIGGHLAGLDIRVRVLTTDKGQKAVAAAGLEGIGLLPGHDDAVEAIANPPHQVKTNPLRLARQLESNLNLMKGLQEELRSLWQADRPDLVLVDSVLPVAGWLALAMDIPWWTSVASPCAIETRTGTPSYLGGWMPAAGLLSRWRDRLGRRGIRIFKSLVAWRYRKQFNQLGLPSIYRADGTEAVYSPEKILALGLREFEFDRDWPASLEFIGYPRGAPGFGAPVPPIQDDRPHILVSLGTHLLWAKDRALGLIVDLAERLPGVVFHFSRGLPGGTRQEMTGRVLVCDYIPYDQCLSGYRAVIFHGGSGLLQSCLFHGLPMLVWPHDYDQFDHAARIVHHGLGLKLKLSPQDAVQQIQFLLSDDSTQWRLHHFRGISRKHAPLERVGELILKRAAR